MSRRWNGKPHTCMIGKCTNLSEYVWYNPCRVRGLKWKVCDLCYQMLKGKVVNE